MKLKIVIVSGIALIALVAVSGLFYLRSLDKYRVSEQNRTVYVERTENGFQLIRNGEPFIIQGGGGDSYFEELASVGGNTVRIFSTDDIGEKLDEAHRHNLAVIVDIWLPYYSTEYDMYAGDVVETLRQEIADLVNEHKDHPALLIWNLGNEINYPLVFRKNSFIRIFNDLVSMVQELDPNHPVSTSIIGAGRKTMSSVFFHSPHLDIIAFNTFGNTAFVNDHLAQTSFLFGPRPYFFSELGPTGPWESQFTSWGSPIEAPTFVKSELYRSRIELMKANEQASSLGALVFYWGSKLERTHTWFSLFKDDRKSESVRVIESVWKQSGEPVPTSGLEYMLVNKRRAENNIILSPGESSVAEIFFKENPSDSLVLKWEIYPEAWYSDTHELVVENYIPVGTFLGFEENQVRFRAPLREGPYRIFAYVYNEDGTFASTNIPFYVLNNH
ncbi:MAG: hypothetical protein LAT84_06000 [Balneolia bacterium]|nr:hypothetical protein [Balneolia bacterium]